MNAMTAPLKPIDSAAELPRYISNVGLPGSTVSLRAEDAAIVALLDIGDRRLIVLWAGEPHQHQVLVAAKRRAEMLGYQVVETRVATKDVVALCADDIGRQETAEAEGLEDTATTRDFDEILAQAVSLGASDLHILPMRDHAKIRVRINGDLYDLRLMTRKAAESMSRAMYSQAEVDSRNKQPAFNPKAIQDASITRSITVNGRVEELKLRWASGPVWPDAFDVSLRILNVAAENRRSLSSLGYTPEQEALLIDALRQPAGVILLCGTTGAGKSTTIASLAELWGHRHQGRRMLRTIENPPEYVISNSRQMPVSISDDSSREDDGFHRALRAAMRMDPDALYFGEVRDPQTADLLEQGVLTGHPVFTTVHAYSPIAALWRLQELGITRERLSSEGFVNLIVHQHLVKILCPHCRRPYDRQLADQFRDQELRQDLGDALLDGAYTRGSGCAHCKSGLIGRRAVASMLAPDHTFRRLFRAGDEMGAIAHWRSGKMTRHRKAQGLSEIQQAKDLIRAGDLCPFDAEADLGRLVEEIGVE